MSFVAESVGLDQTARNAPADLGLRYLYTPTDMFSHGVVDFFLRGIDSYTFMRGNFIKIGLVVF